MSEKRRSLAPSTSSKHPKGGSGEHPVVQSYRNKLDSISEHTTPELDAVIERIKKLKRKSDRPGKVKDPRREESGDPRREDEVPIDIVEPDVLPVSATIKKE